MQPARHDDRTSGQNGKEPDEPIQLAGAALTGRCHVCAFFNGPDEAYQVLLPFIKEGIERGEKAFHVVDPKLRETHLRQLDSVGIDAAAAEQNGQLELRDWHQAYLREGHFDQGKMLALLQGALDEAKQSGFPLTRLVAQMEWALEDRPGVDDIVEYETRLNYVLPRYRDPVICMYDLSKFGADVVVDVLRTHPMAIIGGVLMENPFFVPPDEFLRELRARGERRKRFSAAGG